MGGKYLVYSDIHDVVEVGDEIYDYKIFCFDGKPKFVKVDFGRFSDHHANYFTKDWIMLPFGEADFPPVESKKILPPPNLDKMLNMASKLSKGHALLRVDFYNKLGKIYFGELTFYPASGFGSFTSNEWDRHLGNLIILK